MGSVGVGLSAAPASAAPIVQPVVPPALTEAPVVQNVQYYGYERRRAWRREQYRRARRERWRRRHGY